MNTRPIQLLLGLSAAVAAAAPAAAQPFAADWSSIDGGGATTPLTGGAYTVVGTAGQPDAGPFAGSPYAAVGGFWAIGGAGGGARPPQPERKNPEPTPKTLFFLAAFLLKKKKKKKTTQ